MALTYESYFAKLNFDQYYALQVRDVPGLIKKYVSGTKTLDFGCAGGRSSIFLKSLGMGLNVDGVDINENMIESARRNDPTGHYEVTKNGEIPVKDYHYDFVFVKHVFLRIETENELQNILNEISRVLRVGGTLIVVDNNPDTYNTEWTFTSTRFRENENLRSGQRVKEYMKASDLVFHDTFWSSEDTQKMMRNAGFKVVQVHRPLGKDDDGVAWRMEKEKSPFINYVAQRIF
ncbi:unnamed protein product [Bemisia tabaci]|uniref:Methyltransferase type 11 domain-containing protein n=1 Tax=Bemisia tabaci TaxID=7038 RepID=A0A9P0AB41_BEMTA|nr:unnamed protein product [Bemisia tabaci]